VLAETISKNDPASPRHKAGLPDDIRKDGQSIAATEFTFSILALPTAAPARGIGLAALARISGEVESIFKELCRGLNVRYFSSACYVTYGTTSTGALRPTNYFCLGH
jgi:hypothetical protein